MNLALLREHAQAAGQFLDHALFPRAQASEIDLGIGELDAPILGLMGFLDQLGHVQQGFGRNAAAVEADAAGIRFRIDQRDLHAQIGGEKCRGVTTRPAAHHCNVSLKFQSSKGINHKDTKVHEGNP